MRERTDTLVIAHLGFVAHRDSCAVCIAAMSRQDRDTAGRLLGLCDEGEWATDRALELLAAQLVTREVA